ncbi:MAG: Gfo/Idh/MocA family oxidoreductase [Chloroflexi bacterium]|nr:Gfo/Idh/MocA family oxidoreductase [Chloroflexota bacterium]
MTMDVLRIGLVGAGAISSQHFEAIAALPSTRLGAVASASEERARAAGTSQGVPWTTRIDDLLARDDVDAVTICSPSGLHSGQALAALQAGKHVLIEKPIALAVADADRVIAEALARGLVAAVVSQRRFEPAVRALKAAVDAGHLGRVALVIGEGLYDRPQSYYDSAAWRGTTALDGGVLMNQAIHTIDLMRWIGGPVVAVSGQVATLGHSMETEDTAAVAIRFASGALGTMTATTCARPEQPEELRVYGDKGHVRLSGATVAEWDVPGATVPSAGDDAADDPRDEADDNASLTRTWGTSSAGYLRQYADLVAAVRTGGPPAVTARDGRDAVELIVAAYESSRTGHEVAIGRGHS